MSDRPRVGISRCLLGDEVRYDGTHRRDDTLVATFGDYVEWVPVCPEVDVGMGTPREPIQLVARPDGVPSAGARVRLLGVNSGEDWTIRMSDWARERVQELKPLQLSGYILKASSPSCGIDRVRVYHPSSGPPEDGPPKGGHYVRDVHVRSDVHVRRVRLQPDQETRSGRGLFAQALIEAMPDLPITDEERLSDPRAREEFLQHVLHAFRKR